jgi:hypothetical protein
MYLASKHDDNEHRDDPCDDRCDTAFLVAAA